MQIKHIEVESRVFIKGRNITKWPLSITELTDKLNLNKPVEVIYANNMPLSIGAYTRETDLFYYVFVNMAHPPRRQRFCICHDFGHLVLRHEGVSIHKWNQSDVVQDIENYEADCFARALLMPADKLYGLASCYKDIPTIIDKAQQYFDVSLSAAAKRITQLSLFEGVILLREGVNDIFCYATPNLNDIAMTKEHHIKRLDSGKILHIFIEETYIQLAEMEIG